VTSTPGNSDFDAKRAELFEALGHPVRMRILEALDGEGLGFSELKRRVGLESSGHLSFHLAKLGDLLKVNEEGVYVLTGDGREALRMARTMRAGPDHEWKGLSRPPNIERIVIVGLLIGLVLLRGLAVILQQQNASLSNALLSNQSGTLTIDGQRFLSVTVPFMSNGTTVSLGQVRFTFLKPDASFVQLGTQMNVSNVTMITLPCIGNHSANAICGTFLPEVIVTFSDGTKEYFNKPTIATSHSQDGSLIVNIQYFPPQTSPWFTSHNVPRAGVLYYASSAELTFYVSV
jgi:DNA-binding transcriptional ArsR family regulator